jgi:hypothetical protein
MPCGGGRCPQTYLARPRSIEWSIQGFLAFIAFNATVVFGSGAVRWLGLAACVMIALLVGLRYSGRKGRPSDGGSA